MKRDEAFRQAYDARRYDDAEAIARAWIEVEPSDAEAQLALGRALFRRQQPLRALRALRRAHDLAPAHADVATALGGVWLHLGRTREAIAVLRAVTAPTTATQHNLLTALWLEGRFREAMDVAEDCTLSADVPMAIARDVLGTLEEIRDAAPEPRLDSLIATLAGRVGRRARPRTAPRAEPRSIPGASRELVSLARSGLLPPVSQRDTVVDAVIDVLLRARKSNPLLVGSPGVGKTAVVEALANRIARGDVPERLRGVRLHELSLASLLAGTELRGALEERIRALVDGARSDPDAVLFIDEIHLLAQPEGRGVPAAVADLLKPALARGEMSVIGATTDDEYDRSIERDPTLARRFVRVPVLEPSRDETLPMLLAAAAQLADHHAVAIDATLCESAFALAREALAGRSLPDSAIDLLDAAAVRAVRRGSTAVGRDDLSSAGVQLSRIAGPRRFASLASELAEAVPAQRAAAERLGEVIAARALAFDGDARPRACVLLAGSRGSGRQRLVRALARTLHGDEARTTTVELSTYGEPHHVARLFGAPAGYAGYDEGSLLARVLRRSPDALIVLRDVDRANPEVLAALAPLLREGRATDARGDALDARHATFVLTVERSLRSTRVGFVGSESSPRTDLRVPTIADAIDAVIELAAHDREALALLADARVRDLVVRLSGESVALEVDPAVALHLADLAFAADGTHTLSREFDHALLLPIGRALATRAPSRLRVQLRDGSIVIDAIE